MSYLNQKIYVIAHNWRGAGLEIEHFFTPEKAVKRISVLISDEYGIKADPNDDPIEYLYRWDNYLVENEYECNISIAIHIIE